MEEKKYTFWAEEIDEEGNNNHSDKESVSYENNAELLVRDKEERFIVKLVKGICFIIIASLSFYGFLMTRQHDTPKKQERLHIKSTGYPDIRATVAKNNLPKTNGERISAIIEELTPSIIAINIRNIPNAGSLSQNIDGLSRGTGIIIEKSEDELYIVTSYQVVENAVKISIIFMDQTEVNASVKGMDQTSGLALISVSLGDLQEETISKLKIAQIGDDTEIKVGEMVLAIGSTQETPKSVTVGYISAKNRQVMERQTLADIRDEEFIQTDAAINMDNNGGPLINLKGEVIGINSLRISRSDVEGMGYAIPMSQSLPIIKELAQRENLEEDEKGYIGIVGSNVSKEDIEKYNMPKGVYVVEVTKGSAADKAGIKVSDIIAEFNGMETRTIIQLRDRATSLRKGTKVKVKYKRLIDGEYKEKTIEIKLGGAPEAPN